ncbi:MAG: S8 family peptidase [Bacteroidales bacterium]|nr:S8 family peptidase [Bacteroidales bacterium]MCF8391802.1 S8 family peptidase [Bacteroidales bacterium]
MKRTFILSIAILAIGMFSCEREIGIVDPPQTDEFVSTEIGEIIPGKYIVVLENRNDALKTVIPDNAERTQIVTERANILIKDAGISSKVPERVYATALQGFSIELDDREVESLRTQEGVSGIYPDRMFILKKPAPVPVDPPAETIPYGITRVNGGISYTGTSVAWIIDSGIDLDHPDLNVDASRSVTFVVRTTTGDDDNGHGSHCAGIVAAKDNDIGVVGVAAGATLVAVKVLDKRGSGATSGVIAGVDYVAANANPGDVANMSLGGGAYEPLDLAVEALGDAGILVALAAGNESDDANNHSPARANGANLYTVSAMDSNDYWASFSNYGNPPVDYCAPGVYIYSTYKSGGYATMSGTSMAAPHVCGLLLLTGGNLHTDGTVIGDPDGNPDPIAYN